MKKNVSIKDIAERMNVSLSTVNKALHNKKGISEARREEILRVSREMGYVCNSVAQSLARNPITVGVLIPDRWPEYFKSIRDGICTEFERMRKYKIFPMFYSITDEDAASEEKLSEWISQHNIKAIILCASAHTSTPTIKSVLSQLKLPVFQVGEEQKYDDAVLNVVTDSNLSGRLAADFLTCIHKENVKAVVFTGTKKIDVHRQKVESFMERVSRSGGETLCVMETRDDDNIAYSSMESAFEKHKDINSVYVSTSTSASVCRFIEEHGLKEKIKVVGTDLFDELKEYMKKGVMQATVFQEQETMGKTVVRSVYEYIIRDNNPDYEEEEFQKKILVRPTLYLRANVE